MNDFIDHLLARSFGADDAKNKLQPRIPGLFEAWQGDAIEVEEEEMPGTDSVAPPTAPPTPDIPLLAPTLLADTRRQGVLLPPERHTYPQDIQPHRETWQPVSEAASPPPNQPVQLRSAPAEPVPQPEIVPPDKPVVEPVALATTALGPTAPVPVTPRSRPQPVQESGPQPVQPAPVRLETIEQTVVQLPDATTNIRIHIGRIEVRLPQPGPSPAPPTSPPARPRAPFRPPMSLRDYMDHRRR
jgi:hypothetical protein